jgi:hypothetical protein
MSKKIPPNLKSSGDLHKRLMVHIIGGFWNVLNKESKNYFHLLLILIDKSVYEYNYFYGFVCEDIKNDDPLSNRLRIVWHLENCINAIGRVSKVLGKIINGFKGQKKTEDIAVLINKSVDEKIGGKIASIRNRIEHIDEDIFLNDLSDSFLISPDETYENLKINKIQISVSDLALLIDSFYDLLIDINNHLPNRTENGQFYYDKK